MAISFWFLDINILISQILDIFREIYWLHRRSGRNFGKLYFAFDLNVIQNIIEDYPVIIIFALWHNEVDDRNFSRKFYYELSILLFYYIIFCFTFSLDGRASKPASRWCIIPFSPSFGVIISMSDWFINPSLTSIVQYQDIEWCELFLSSMYVSFSQTYFFKSRTYVLLNTAA